jgi:hypothetical protein
MYTLVNPSNVTYYYYYALSLSLSLSLSSERQIALNNALNDEK